MIDFDPRDYDSPRTERGGIERDPGSRGSSDAPRERDTEPRDVFVRDLRLPRGHEREIVHDSRDRAYTLRGSESRTMATVGAFRVVPASRLRDHAVASDCRHNRARVYHVHYQRLYAAIGDPESRYRRPVPAARAMERVMLLDAVIATPGLEWLTNESDKRAYLAKVISAGRGDDANNGDATGSRRPSNRFAGRFPLGIDSAGRFVLLYVATVPWPDEFRIFVDAYAAFFRDSRDWTLRLAFPSPVDGAYERYLLSSTALSDALAAGKGRVERLVLPHRYRHLSPLASLVRSNAKPVEKVERVGERPPARSQPPAPPGGSAPLTVAEELERNWYRSIGRS
jgi:hypothetical protein